MCNKAIREVLLITVLCNKQKVLLAERAQLGGPILRETDRNGNLNIRLWENGRVELWEEKLRLRPPFTGNAATAWGTGKEATALAEYCKITGSNVSEECMFKVRHYPTAHQTLGRPDTTHCLNPYQTGLKKEC
eukprot:scaffold320593_cov21-Prasinocladus_malaysianus.AAC.1